MIDPPNGFFRQDDGITRIYRSAFPLCSWCPRWSIPLNAGSYLPEVAQSFEDALDLAGALRAFAAELGGECFGGGGRVGSEKLPEQGDLLGESGGPNWISRTL